MFLFHRYIELRNIHSFPTRRSSDLKVPESERFRENHGFREAITAEQVEAAMHMLCSRGIEITDVYNSFGAVAVRMDADEVFYLFDHPMVDYISLPMEFRLGWGPQYGS